MGYVHVYTGDGKGKSTAALGLAIRMLGAGKKVFFAQFIKGKRYAEFEIIDLLAPNFILKQYGLDCFIEKEPTNKDVEAARHGLSEVAGIIKSGKYDLVVLDEANIALYYKLFSLEELLLVIGDLPQNVEIVITGRKAPQQLIDVADLVTEMKEIKHYYQNGIQAREGVEF